MFDTADVLTAITAAGVAVGSIGAAVVAGPAIIRAAWRWIRTTVG